MYFLKLTHNLPIFLLPFLFYPQIYPCSPPFLYSQHTQEFFVQLHWAYNNHWNTYWINLVFNKLFLCTLYKVIDRLAQLLLLFLGKKPDIPCQIYFKDESEHQVIAISGKIIVKEKMFLKREMDTCSQKRGDSTKAITFLWRPRASKRQRRSIFRK